MPHSLETFPASKLLPAYAPLFMLLCCPLVEQLGIHHKGMNFTTGNNRGLRSDAKYLILPKIWIWVEAARDSLQRKNVKKIF